jgi:hypothetical protein
MFAILVVVATLLVAAACEAPSQPTFASLAVPERGRRPMRRARMGSRFGPAHTWRR